MGTKMEVAFANIIMGKVESQIRNQSTQKPLAWRRYIDAMFSTSTKDKATQFIEQVNSHHPTIKFTAEVSDTETFLDTNVYKDERFQEVSVPDITTHSKATETFQYTYFSMGSKRVSSKANY